MKSLREKVRGRHKYATNMKEVFRNENGAIDLASIMVGIVVIGLIGGVIAATVFTVIPWAQDNAAKASLDAVVSSESAAKGLHERFLSGAELNSKGLLPSNEQLIVGTDTDGTCYVGVIKSQTGKMFYNTSKKTKPDIYTNGMDTDCLKSGEINNLDSQVLPNYTNETILGWASNDLSAVASDESAFGVKNGMLSTYVDFVNHSTFPTDFASAASSRDAALLIAWEPYNWDDTSLNQTSLRPANIAAGNYDAYITDWLKNAQGYAKNNTIMVRFAPEMNDAVRPWSVGVNGGNTPQDYINMWKHVYDIKKTVAPDVIMVWNPLVAGSDPSGNPVSLSSVYPGSAYVDVLALDGFNWADIQNPGTCGWQSYDDVFKNPIAEVKTLANGKPWGIAEVASASKPDSYFRSGGPCYDAWGSWVYNWPEKAPYYSTASDWITQAGWMKTMMQQAHADGALFVNMFNTQKETDWRLNSTTDGAGVLTALKADTAFKAGEDNSGGYIKAALKK